ncbi:hypothetical protein ACFQNF_16170 [Iodobacter arcticus]|uniref:DUF7079 domain-containing protein n=1 Tax=Iodobacter arcticus TaxID=590593 RepID=A0ABW2R5W5_9NEIS
MEHSLSQEQLEAVWVALADVFSVPEEEYSYLAQQVNDIQLDEIKEIFFNDVAPVFTYNLVITTPELLGFDPEQVILAIRKEKEKNKSKFRKSLHKLYVAYLRWNINELWVQFESEVIKQKNSNPSQ